MNIMTSPPRGPLYRQIYDRIRGSIVDGRLQPGERLPSARALAQEMGVARGTVDTAYAILGGEGYVETNGRGGTRVIPGLVLAGEKADAKRAPAKEAALQNADQRPLCFLPLTPGLPSFDLFPRTLWAQLVRRRAHALGAADMAYPETQGLLELREAVASYLTVARGVNCAPEEIIITGGFQAAVGLIARELDLAGRTVWVEDPGYPPISRALQHIGARPIPVPVDLEGIDVAAGIARGPSARLCIVAPAHQFPTGVTLSLARRMQLLEWAERADAFILEDDFDGEFRYQGRPQPALRSLDRSGRVLYAGTFSKTLFPGMRLGYLVAPQPLMARFRNAARYMDGGRPMLDQAVVAEFLARGHFARHVKRMRNVYRVRRTALADALAARFDVPEGLAQGAGGLNLILPIAGGLGHAGGGHWSEGRFLGAIPLAQLTQARVTGDALLVGFTNVPEKHAATMAARLHDAVLQGRATTADTIFA